MTATLTRPFTNELNACLQPGKVVRLHFVGGDESPLESYAAAYGTSSITAIINSVTGTTMLSSGGSLVSAFQIIVDYDESIIPGSLKTIEDCTVCDVECISGCTGETCGCMNQWGWPIVADDDEIAITTYQQGHIVEGFTIAKIVVFIAESGSDAAVSLQMQVNGVDVLSTPITIDLGELNSETAAVGYQIDEDVLPGGVIPPLSKISWRVIEDGADTYGDPAKGLAPYIVCS